MRRLGFALIVSALALYSGASVIAADLPLYSGVSGSVSMRVVSLKEARFTNVIKQQYDFSCGSAALASLLTHHYQNPISEAELFTKMYEAGDQEKIRKIGFSLLDMKNQLARMGYRSDGYKMTLSDLSGIGVPAIALINTRGYKHFVLIKGISQRRVVIGDPAAGNRVLTHDELKEIWDGTVFLIRNKAKIGRAYFNLKDDWGVQAKAPFGTALNRQSLGSLTVHMRSGTNTF